MRPQIPGIDIESLEQKSEREKRAAAQLAEAQALRRKQFVAEAAICRGLVGLPLAALLCEGIERYAGLRAKGLKCQCMRTTAGAEGAEMIETSVEDALASGFGELLALYAPGALNHPAVPAIATFGLVGLAIMHGGQASKPNGAAPPKRTENSAIGVSNAGADR